MFVEFALTWFGIAGDVYGEMKWVPKLGALAKSNGVEIKGTYNFHERTRKVLEPEEQPDFLPDGKPNVKKTKKVRTKNFMPVIMDANEPHDEDIEDDGDYSVKGWKEAVRPSRVLQKAHMRLIMFGWCSSRLMRNAIPYAAERPSVVRNMISRKCPRPIKRSTRLAATLSGLGLFGELGSNLVRREFEHTNEFFSHVDVSSARF